MASTVLPNGIIIPEKFSRDWYADLYHNWQELDNLLGGGTPKDGTLTIQKNGTTVGTFSANQATDETINIEVPDVNNGTLTIQKNSTTIGTFGANQATDETINIEVPDVNNGTLTIQQNGTTVDTFTANSSSDKTVNIQCVDLNSNQTIGGVKTFSNGDKTFNDSAPLRIQGCNKGNEFSGNARTVLELRSNRDTADKSCIYITKFRQNRAQGSLGDNDSVLLTMDVFENEVRTNDLLRFTAHNWINDVPTEMFLEPPTKASNIQSFLGTSSRPWGNTTTNAINGINPGALSLPSSTYINVDTTNWDVAGGTNVYTPPANGWLHIRVVGATELMVRWTGWGFGDRRVSATATDLGVTIPVVAGVTVDVVTVASGFDGKCQFFPCQGNV